MRRMIDDDAELAIRIKGIVSTLTRFERQAFLLHYGSGSSLSLKNVGKQLGVPKRVVSDALHGVFEKLRPLARQRSPQALAALLLMELKHG